MYNNRINGMVGIYAKFYRTYKANKYNKKLTVISTILAKGIVDQYSIKKFFYLWIAKTGKLLTLFTIEFI